MFKKYSFLAPLIILGLILFILIKTSLFKIKQIDCLYNQTSPCSENLIAELDRHQGKNLLSFNASNLRQKIQASDPTISSVAVQIILPSSLIVEVTGSQALIELSNFDQNTFASVDQKGNLIEIYHQSRPNLPQIMVSQIEFTQLEVISQLAQALLNANLDIFPLKITQNSISTTSYSPQIYFSLDKSPQEQVASLQLIHSTGRIKGQEITKIDLRFNQPVITY